ncbi:MAG: hypothetical protein DRJ09_11405, partial [Bacteroidetes bacterium]
MSKKKHKKKEKVSYFEKSGLKAAIEQGNPKLLKWLIVIVTVIFYGNVIFNGFSLDDKYINVNNPQTSRGIEAIPDIFTSFYAHEAGNAYGYRPLVRVSYALEYQFTKDYIWNPAVSHFINLLLYIVGLLILFRVLRRLLNGYSPWIAFFITLLYLIHPTHTEVVASLKNRDILLEFIFAFEAVWLFIRWADSHQSKFLYWGIVSYILALLSKETAIVHLAVFPLVLYFFTDIGKKKLLYFTGAITLLGLAIFLAPVVLFNFERNFHYIENPLFYENSFFNKLATSFYILGFYLKLLVIPYPLRYYYGFNMIPVTNWANPLVWLSFLFYVGIFVVAVKYFKQKKIISFIILFFLIQISMYANLVMPVPGIVGDRFAFYTSLAFAWFIVWLFVEIPKQSVFKQKSVPAKPVIIGFALALLYILPMGYWDHIRNFQWRSQYLLFNSDMPFLENSVKANDLWAAEIIKKVNRELAKPVNPYHFIKRNIAAAEKRYNKALELDSTFYSAWLNLGSIYSKIHGNQARIRYMAYSKRGEKEKAMKSKDEMIDYFKKAHYYFNQALKYKPDHANGLIYYDIANAYELQEIYDSAERYYKKAIAIDSNFIISRSKLANIYFRKGEFQKALDENKTIMIMEPEADVPYINMGNYYVMFGDTTTALRYYEKAIELGTRPEASIFLNRYYSSRGDKQKAD